MATYRELDNYFFEQTGKHLQNATLSRWVKEGRLLGEKQSNNTYNYDFDSFKNIINQQDYLKRSKATKERPEDYIGKQTGFLLIKGIVPKEEKKEQYIGTLMYCDCLKCGKKDVQVRFSYLTKNGNYTQETCGCGRKERAFLASCRENISQDFINNYSNDFEKFLTVHKILTHTTDKYYMNCDIKEYEIAIDHFYNDTQFNAVYSFWKKQTPNDTFYDWAKPSLDHIIPKSKGGTNKLENLQVLTVFENLAKRDMTQQEWNQFKKNTHTQSDYFIENILK